MRVWPQIHEAGKALFACDARIRTGLVDDIEKVSCVRRGLSLSRTVFARRTDEDYIFVTRKEMLMSLRCVLAGAASAEVLEADASDYAADDIKDARVRFRGLLRRDLSCRFVPTLGLMCRLLRHAQHACTVSKLLLLCIDVCMRICLRHEGMMICTGL